MTSSASPFHLTALTSILTKKKIYCERISLLEALASEASTERGVGSTSEASTERGIGSTREASTERGISGERTREASSQGGIGESS